MDGWVGGWVVHVHGRHAAPASTHCATWVRMMSHTHCDSHAGWQDERLVCSSLSLTWSLTADAVARAVVACCVSCESSPSSCIHTPPHVHAVRPGRTCSHQQVGGCDGYTMVALWRVAACSETETTQAGQAVHACAAFHAGPLARVHAGPGTGPGSPWSGSATACCWRTTARRGRAAPPEAPASAWPQRRGWRRPCPCPCLRARKEFPVIRRPCGRARHQDAWMHAANSRQGIQWATQPERLNPSVPSIGSGWS